MLFLTHAHREGGTRLLAEIVATAVHADHSSGIVDGDQIRYGGEPMGYVIRCVVYHADRQGQQAAHTHR